MNRQLFKKLHVIILLNTLVLLIFKTIYSKICHFDIKKNKQCKVQREICQWKLLECIIRKINMNEILINHLMLNNNTCFPFFLKNA